MDKKASRETSRKFDPVSSREASLLAETVEEDAEESFKTSAIRRGELCFLQRRYKKASREASRKLIPHLSIPFSWREALLLAEKVSRLLGKVASGRLLQGFGDASGRRWTFPLCKIAFLDERLKNK